MKFSKKGWGLKIDYVQAIKEDEKCIAFYTRALANGWTTEKAAEFYFTTFPEIAARYAADPTLGAFGTSLNFERYAVTNPEVATQCGLTPKDVGMLVYTSDGYEDPYFERFPKPPFFDKVPGSVNPWKAGDAVSAKLAECYFDYLDSEERLKAMLKKAKASLSRHKRNQKLYGQGTIK